MVSFFFFFFWAALVSQYCIHILDYPRRKYNMGYQVFVNHQRPEPFWFEAITAANQFVFLGSIVFLIIFKIV